MVRGMAISSYLVVYREVLFMLSLLPSRCPPPQGNDAISQEGAVQAAAASAVGITVPPPATPAACTVAAAATH